ncbi:efflux RND transporter periplasmic adaptor subunit [bacterium]|nr:efflux RND transporter periplasmic adaptor subunit [bacterium]
MAQKKTKIFIAVGALLVIVLLVAGNLNKKGGNAITVQTDNVVRGDITASVSGSARIQPEIQVKISAKVSGQIIRLDVKEGDAVRKGQFLAQLDRINYQAAVNQASSNLDFSNAGYDKARNEYVRAEKLYEDNLTSKAELEIAKSSYEQAKAQVDQSKAALDQAKDSLGKTTIYSPMNGTVSQLNKKLGEMAMGSQFTLDVIMVVADLSRMQAETEIDENDVVTVSLGDTARIEVDAFPDTTFMGIVREIANTGTTRGQGTQEEVTNFLVKVAMITRPEKIRPGMSATVDVLTETRYDVLKIPIQCVTSRKPVKVDTSTTRSSTRSKRAKSTVQFDEEADDILVIFVVEEELARQVKVKTGISSDEEYEIISGLNDGDVVVSGSYRILSKKLKHKDGVKIDNKLKRYGRNDDDNDR